MPSIDLRKKADIDKTVRYAKRLNPSKEKNTIIEVLKIELENCKKNENSAIIRCTLDKKEAWEAFDKKWNKSKSLKFEP